MTLRPDLIQASHGPTPAALTRTKTSPSPGIGRGTSSATSESMPPKLCTRIACMMHLNRHHTRDMKRGPLDDSVAATATDAAGHTKVQWTARIPKCILTCECGVLMATSADEIWTAFTVGAVPSVGLLVGAAVGTS